MRSRRWDRAAVIASVRADVWRYVTQAARREEDVVLEAAALLRMRASEVRTLAAIQFMSSAEVASLLDGMHALTRRLTTTAVPEEETSAERVRGAIQWAPTLSRRASTGLPHLYVTAPARRAFQTPENEVLVSALDAIRSVGRKTGWHRSGTAGVGAQVRERVEGADRWLRTRMLTEVERRPVTAAVRARVRSGRASRRYTPALDVLGLHDRFVRKLDREALRRAIESNALLTSQDDVLMELLCAFRIEAALRELGWKLSTPGLVRGGVLVHGSRGGEALTLWYQNAPKQLSTGSVYRGIQRNHSFRSVGGLIPDFVFRTDGPDGTRWLLVEVKGGPTRTVDQSARRAILDLLAYRRAFESVLSTSAPPYGLGIAWGTQLAPSGKGEIAVCTPDTIREALEMLM